MQFSTDQLKELRAPLSTAHVKEREQGGRKVSYIEGWHAEAEANRIFGEHAWDSAILDLKCVSERQRKIGKGQYEKDGWGVTYTCTVRVTVTTPEGHRIVRDGAGAGHGVDADVGIAHESALKEAATDAEKRALKTFGNPFGLALYDKSKANVAAPEPAEPAPKPRPTAAIDGAKVAIDMCGDEAALNAWVKEHTPALKRMQAEHPDAYEEVMAHAKLRKDGFRKNDDPFSEAA